MHPELQGRPFYIAGEACHPLRLPLPPPRLVTAITCEWPQSYGGHYVPNLAKAIQTHNAAATTPVSLRIALKGIAGAVQPTATLASSHAGGSRATRCFVSKRFALGSRERNHWWGRSVDLRSGQRLRRLAARLQHERAVRKVRSQRHRRRPTQPTRTCGSRAGLARSVGRAHAHSAAGRRWRTTPAGSRSRGTVAHAAGR
jgi:hypothetical protein